MHCKTCPLPVENSSFTCSSMALNTVKDLFREMQSHQIYSAFSTDIHIFIPCWNCKLRVFTGPAHEEHFYTVLYGLMTFCFFCFDTLLHIRGVTVLLVYQLEKAVSYNYAEMYHSTSDVSLICDFFYLESNGCFLVFYFSRWRGGGGVSEPGWSL